MVGAHTRPTSKRAVTLMESIKSTSEAHEFHLGVHEFDCTFGDNTLLSFLAENFSGWAPDRPVGAAPNIAIIVIKTYSQRVPGK
jgi:hypothetical protein